MAGQIFHDNHAIIHGKRFIFRFTAMFMKYSG